MNDGELAWWQRAFDATYVQRYAHRDDQLAASEVAGLLLRLRSAPGPILDACCGAGRHLQAFRASGLRAWGFDWSLPLLREAQQRPGLRQALVRGDMRQPPLAAGWGAITMLFTAFGYFNDAENAATLGALARLLLPQGWLVLDLAHAGRVRQGLVPHSTRSLPDGTQVEERRWLEGNQVCKQSRWLTAEGEQVVDERVRLYEPEELAKLAAGHGLRLVDVWPSLRGESFDDDRQVLWLQR